MTRRTERIDSLLRDAVQQVLARGLQDPRISGLLTVTSVKISPDLRSATVLVSVFPEEKQDLTLHGLKAAAGHVRHEVASIIDMRKVPELIFRADLSLKKQAAVVRDVLRAVAERGEEAGGPPAPSEDAP